MNDKIVELEAELYEKNQELKNLKSELEKITDLKDDLDYRKSDLHDVKCEVYDLKQKKKYSKALIVIGIISALVGLSTGGYYLVDSMVVKGVGELIFAVFGVSLAGIGIVEGKNLKLIIERYSNIDTKLSGEVTELQKEVDNSLENEVSLNKSISELLDSIDATEVILNGIKYINKEDIKINDLNISRERIR